MIRLPRRITEKVRPFKWLRMLPNFLRIPANFLRSLQSVCRISCESFANVKTTYECLTITTHALPSKKERKVWFYIALYPVRWTAQSALHFPPLADLFIPTPFSASLGSILAMQQLRNYYSLTFPPLYIARYSFIQLSRLRRREVKENAQTSTR